MKTCAWCECDFHPHGNACTKCSLGCYLWANTDKGNKDDCWNWNGSKFWFGHGRICWNNKILYSHRVSWEIEHCAQVPNGLCVLHNCDNPSCVNPRHLFLGTKKENNLDRDRKGRQVASRGEKHGMAKLSNSDVNKIRLLVSSGETCSSVDKKFNISQGYSWKISSRKNWKHVA